MIREKKALLDDENPIPASQRPKADLYETHEVLTRALMGHVDLPSRIWEPAAGKGAISRVLEAGGHVVLKTDLFDHGVGEGIQCGLDFLNARPHAHAQTIVTNPPFNQAAEFVQRALEVADVSYFLMRVQFVNRGTGRKMMSHLAGLYPLAPRPGRMHMDGWTGPTAGGRGDYAWYCFSRHHVGNTDFRPIYWRDYEKAPASLLDQRDNFQPGK